MDKTWELDLRINSDGCPHRSVYDFCVLWGQDCTLENCDARVEDEPITAEWLESLGAINQGFSYQAYIVHIRYETVWFDIRFLDVLLIRLNILHRAVDIDIKNRHEFKVLFKVLAGKELGE